MAVAKRILIADDDPDVHRLLLAALEAPGRQIDAVHDGQQALARVASCPYDLVLADVNMSGLDGLCLLQRLRELNPAAKVVVITGESAPENIVRSIRDQAFAYFSKPFTVSAVADMVAKALRSAPHEDH